MNQYNEYVAITRSRLKEYNMLKARVKVLDQQIAQTKSVLDSEIAAPIANYSGMPRGGGSELNVIEAATHDRMKRQNDLSMMILNRDTVQSKIDNIDSAIGSLQDDEQDIIKERYIYADSWEHIGCKRHYSERWAREKGGKALKKIAFVLFGLKARPPEQIRFVFAQ